MPPRFSCPDCVVLRLSDLSKSPLLHILQLVFPLEPKKKKHRNLHLKNLSTFLVYLKSLWTISWALTWLVLGVQSDSSFADS